MPRKNFRKLAKQITKKDKKLFDKLEKIENPKSHFKTRMNFTIDKRIAAKFRSYCEKEGYNMSAKVEKAMREMIKEK